MPFARPTLLQLRDQVLADITAAAAVGPLLSRAVLRVLAYAQAGLAWLHFSFLDRVAKQCTPWSATDEWLEAWAALKGITRKSATAASGTGLFTGSPSVGVVANGASVTSADGTLYTVTAGGTCGGGGTVTVALTAAVAGSAGNLVAGSSLTLTTPPDGVNAMGSVATALTGGADAELDDALRTRMLIRYAAPPQGGAVADYLEWTLAVPGVTRAWIAPLGGGAGTVWVYPMLDGNAYGGFPQGTNGVATGESRGTPATGDQLAVANALFPLRPVTAEVVVKAATASPVNFTISDLLPSDAATQAAVTAALAGVFARRASVGGTTWPVTNANTANGRLYMSDFTGAIDAVPGVVRYTLTAPSTTVVAATGALPTLGTVTFV